MKPYRFGVMLWRTPGEDWTKKIKRMEELGYSSIMIPDHPNTQWCPIATQAAIASVTEKIKVGSLVFNLGFHHPVMLAKSSATIQNLSKGRCEFGLGAGWDETEYEMVGLKFEKVQKRISRLEEALQIIQSMWTRDGTSFEGKHYKVYNAPRAASHMKHGPPKTVIGAGSRRTLSIAGRYADIVNIIPTLPSSDYWGAVSRDPLTYSRLKEKISLVEESAKVSGREHESIEYSFLYLPGTEITDDPESAARKSAEMHGIKMEDMVKSPSWFFGTFRDMRSDIEKRYRETGINYHLIPGNIEEFQVLEDFAEEVIKPLTV